MDSKWVNDVRVKGCVGNDVWRGLWVCGGVARRGGRGHSAEEAKKISTAMIYG
ncbi:hypothetical protein [Bartonella jaculi]|uniref:Uncharacterized protein n=1 Tax=Bartonella jaculi TaxID=686226 RepID=A0ABP9N6J0_9HYPH